MCIQYSWAHGENIGIAGGSNSALQNSTDGPLPTLTNVAGPSGDKPCADEGKVIWQEWAGSPYASVG